MESWTRSKAAALLFLLTTAAIFFTGFWSLISLREEPSLNVLAVRADEEASPRDQAVRSGRRFQELLDADISCVKQSEYTEITQLQTHGWRRPKGDVSIPVDDMGRAFENMWKDLSMPNPRETLQQFKVMHTVRKGSQPEGPGTKHFQATEGEYTNLIGQVAIVAGHNYSPEYRAKNIIPPVKPEDIIPLRCWSDVVFLEWMWACQQDETKMRKLLYVIRKSIVTGMTRSIGMEALQRSSGKKLQDCNWSRRVTWQAGTSEFLAMLATPHGKGVVWLLAQHKEQLGWKTISAITVFSNPPHDPAGLNIVFTLEDHESVEPKQPEDS